LAATLKKELALDSELVRGGNGIFNITVDDRLIFSRHDAGRFPTEAEIVDQLRKLA
jgi:selenoprotein W-related protein